jgi:hypothetical protein
MKTVIHEILAAHGKLQAFRSCDDFFLKLSSDGFMPLTIERHGNRVIVAHYFEQNGDLVPDPDMEFLDRGGEDFLAASIQHSTGFYQRCVEEEDGRIQVRLGLERSLRNFATMWARNLKAQGFKQGKVLAFEVSGAKSAATL